MNMNILHKALTLGVTLTWALAAGVVHAEQKVTQGDYEIHYNALATQFLTPAVSRQYDIPRSKNRALLNVTALRRSPDNPLGEAVFAVVSATATNLTGLRRELPMTLIEESQARYYVGHLRVAHEETLKFDIEVRVEGLPQPVEISFRQKFYAD